MPLNPLAVELNNVLENATPHVMHMLSQRGKAIYFPQRGILAQSAEAAGKDINATIGTAQEDDGSPMVLESIAGRISLPKNSVFPYAPSFGRPEIRAAWRDMLAKKNPSMDGKSYSNPVVSLALTHGLSMAGYLFVDPGDTIIIPDLYWENYDLVFGLAYGGNIVTYPTFVNGGYNIAALRDSLLKGKAGKRIVVLNFPNNPTGYTATAEEGQALRTVLVEAAERGNEVIVFLDDAYFGLVYEPGVMTESLFGHLCNAHERLLAVKFDGPTKEDYVWGFRVGFVTFGIKGGTPEVYKALEAKLAGAIRGNISNAPNLSQSLLLAAYKDPSYDESKRLKFEILKNRYDKIKEIFRNHPEYAEVFEALPYNSGYFMCIKIKNGNSEQLRQLLITKYSTGLIAIDSRVLRLAFSSVPHSQMEKLFANIFSAGKEME